MARVIRTRAASTSSHPAVPGAALGPRPLQGRQGRRSAAGEPVPVDETLAAELVDGRPKSDRVAESIVEALDAEGVKAGVPLPGELELAERFGVSRVTIRRALARLVEAGRVEKGRNGRWVVSREPVAEPTDALMSFTELAERRGLHVRSKVLRADARLPSSEEESALEVGPKGRVFELVRLRLLDDQPMGLQRAVVPLWLAPGIEKVDFSRTSLYAWLRERCDVVPTRADSTVRALPADRKSAALLGIAEGAPILSMRQLGFDQKGRPFELAELSYRGDRYSFRGTLEKRRDVFAP
jgi:GntR family transcriptional regulator